MKSYRITVTTGSRDYAGTDANVYITLHGTKGSSGERQIGTRKNFEKGAIDTFTLILDDLGPLTKLRIRHDNANEDEGWFLEEIRVTDEQAAKEYNFPCHRWLADDEDDNRIDRELYAKE